MLPNLLGNGPPIFQTKICAYHETFSDLRSANAHRSKPNTVSIIWQEGIADPRAVQVTSAYVKAFVHDRYAMKVVYWISNCTCQNKNWTQITAVVILPNCNVIKANINIFHYFEPGYIFMSADSFTHGMTLKSNYKISQAAHCMILKVFYKLIKCVRNKK